MKSVQDVPSRPVTLTKECGLYAYALEAGDFDDLALGLYFASGKFDRWSLHAWSTDTLHRNAVKAQNLRASIDNAIVFLPTSGECALDLEGSLVVVGYKAADGTLSVVAIGAIAGEPINLPCDSYRLLKTSDDDKVLPVHILGMSLPCNRKDPIVSFEDMCEQATGVRPAFDWTAHHPDMPRHVCPVVENLPETHLEGQDCGDIGEALDEITKQRVAALGFASLLDVICQAKTPVPSLEAARTRRLEMVRHHVASPGQETPLPPPMLAHVSKKRKVQTIQVVMKEHERHAKRFGKLLTPSL